MAHVTFIHGIANKPSAGALADLWRRGLAVGGGLDLWAAGVTSHMVHWADVLYDRPLDEETAAESLEALEAAGVEPVDLSWRQRASPAELAWTAELETKLQSSLAAQEVATAALPPRPAPAALSASLGRTETSERILLPWFAKERLIETLVRDLHHYLWNVEHQPRSRPAHRVQDEIRRRTAETLAHGAREPGPHVVLSHGMGTVIAYDCLKRTDGPPVDALITLGSPLGLHEVQSRLQPGWTRHDGFPVERVKMTWLNFFDRLDPVAGFAPNFANIFKREGRPVVRDIEEPSYGAWRHDISKYLGSRRLRADLRALLGLAD
jgi:hypothetical protein